MGSPGDIKYLYPITLPITLKLLERIILPIFSFSVPSMGPEIEKTTQ